MHCSASCIKETDMETRIDPRKAAPRRLSGHVGTGIRREGYGSGE